MASVPGDPGVLTVLGKVTGGDVRQPGLDALGFLRQKQQIPDESALQLLERVAGCSLAGPIEPDDASLSVERRHQNIARVEERGDESRPAGRTSRLGDVVRHAADPPSSRPPTRTAHDTNRSSFRSVCTAGGELRRTRLAHQAGAGSRRACAIRAPILRRSALCCAGLINRADAQISQVGGSGVTTRRFLIRL